MDLETVIAQAPEVKPAEDERASFYLENRGLIETWAALRADAANIVVERLLDLAVPLSEDMRHLGEIDVEVGTSYSRGRPSVDLVRAGWRNAGLGSPVQISLEAEQSAIGSRGSLQVFGCVRAKQGHPDAVRWHEPLAAVGPRLRAIMGRNWKSSLPRYVVWKYVDAPEDGWDLEAITLRAREELIRLWVATAPVIDELMAAIAVIDGATERGAGARTQN